MELYLRIRKIRDWAPSVLDPMDAELEIYNEIWDLLET